ncbi:uncharacterized protein LOC116286267 [Actinia tenebrosa]|uniref:Uncharacterized protein LOC116286267 n=1 Tax=Actinia tenebrosa TaxID=6105 RepID=A0A6P8GWE8_ACTTE|nr:uncharacterized protein LOC116286267 [Actinia tenebrosa]
MAGTKVPTEASLFDFDDKSQVWLQPFSEIINCMFPVEYVYGEWIWWQATSEAKRSFNPESLASSSTSEIETGSRVEGFCIPQLLFSESGEGFLNVPFDKRKHWQPDLDEMKIDAFSIANERNEIIPIFTVEHASDDPRYVHLRFTDEWKEHKPSYKNASFINHTYLLPSNEYWSNETRGGSDIWTYEMHGPVRKLQNKGFVHYEEDQTGVFKYPLAWPEPAMEWLVRSRTNGWPSPELLKDILESGCHLAPVGRGKRQNEPMELLEYRKNPEKPSSSSCRETDPENPNDRDIMDERLQKSLEEGHLPHYIIPQSNLLQNEDPAKLVEEAATIHDVRINILPKIVSMLKRCFSLTYQSQTYLNNLQDLDPLLVKVQEKSLTEEDVKGLIYSLLAVFMEKSKDVIGSLFKSLQNEGEDEYIKKMMYIPLYAYQSLLARGLCKMLHLKTAHKTTEEKTNQELLTFMKEKVSDLTLDDDFTKIAQTFFAEIRERRDMSLMIPNTIGMEYTKKVYKELAWHHVDEAQAPFQEQIGWLKKSDMEAMTNKVSEKLKGLLENLTLEDIKAEIDKELKILYEKRHQKESGKETTEDQSV